MTRLLFRLPAAAGHQSAKPVRPGARGPSTLPGRAASTGGEGATWAPPSQVPSAASLPATSGSSRMTVALGDSKRLVNVIADPDLPTQYADRRAPRRRSRNDRHKFRNGRVAAANRDLFPALGPRDELRQLRLRVADGDCLAHVAEATMTWPTWPGRPLSRSVRPPRSRRPRARRRAPAHAGRPGRRARRWASPSPHTRDRSPRWWCRPIRM